MRRFRFSLRSLLLFTLLCGSVMLLWHNREPWHVYRRVQEPQRIWTAGYSPRDTYFYTAIGKGRRREYAGETVKIYERASGRLYANLKCNFRNGPMERSYTFGQQYFFSPGEKYLHPRSPSGLEVENNGMWKIDTGEFVQFEKGKPEDLVVARISENDNFALLGNSTVAMSLVKLPSLEVVTRLPHGGEGVFSPDERWLAFYATRNPNYEIRLYSTATGTEDARLGWSASHGTVQFSPDSHLIAFDSGDYNLAEGMHTVVVELQTGYVIKDVQGHLERRGYNFSPDSRMIFVHEYFKQDTQVWELNSNPKPIAIIPKQGDKFPRVNMLRERMLFHNEILGAFDVHTGTLLWSSSHGGHFDPRGEYAFSHYANELYGGNTGRTAPFYSDEVVAGATGETVLHLERAPYYSSLLELGFANTRPEFLTFNHERGQPPVDPEFTKEVQLWERRRPEAWWGIAWIWEFWLMVGLGVALVWSVKRDR